MKTFDYSKIAQLDGFHKFREALNDLINECYYKQIEFGSENNWKTFVRLAVETTCYADCCYQCKGEDFVMYWPYAHDGKGKFLYLCKNGHNWPCWYGVRWKEFSQQLGHL